MACALELQRTNLSPIRLRIGVHTGDVRLRDEGNYAGPTINKTARLRDLAHGGQTVLSGVTEQLVEDQLPVDAWLADLGRHALRDLPRPVRVSQLCHPDVRNDFPPLRTSNTTAAHHLPAQLTTFVGRHAQMADIRALLADNRLVTLTGAGGAGKTRLAIEVAAQMTSVFPQGIWYADLAPITHPDVVPLAVARALGLPDQPGQSITQTLVRFVRDRQMLLVLDNCEHLLEASAALVNDVLAACSKVTILGTSREPLVVGGEVIWQVPSLSLADEAIELFTDRARRARPDFAVTEGNADTVTEICRRLDGMPLAIELAAARVRALSLNEIRDSLHDRFRLLTGGARTAVRRQQTLRASVDWSHALLTEPERILFRRLAVFMGGFNLDAAQVVAGANEIERFQVLDQLSLLVDKSLVVAQDADGRTWYRLLETVRQYASEKLGESGEADDVRTRHRDHYTASAARLDAPARDDYEHLLAQAEADFDNLRAAFVWSRENNDVTNAVELASSLMPIWLTRGRVSEGVAWLDAAGADSQHTEPATWARAMADRAVLGSWVDISGVVEPAQQALAIARDINEPTLLIRVLMACAFINMHNAEKAQPYFAEATDLARTLGDSWRLSQILSRQSTGALLVGDAAAAALHGEEGRTLADAIGDHFNARQCRLGLAWAHMCRGDTASAISQYADLIAEARNAHDVMSLVSAVVPGAFALAFHGDVDGARATATTAIEACTELGFLLAEAYAGIVMADLAAGDGAAALAAAKTAMRSDTNVAVEKLNWWTAAHAALACGDTVSARRWADASAESTSGMFLAFALAARARVHIAEGDCERAATDAHDGLAITAPMAGYLCVPDLLECLAEVGRDAGSLQHAARLVGAAHAMRERLELPRFKVHDGGHDAVVAALRWATASSRMRMQRARHYLPRRQSPTPCAAAVSASGRRAAGVRSRRPNSTSSASSAKACPTRTSLPGFSSHRERCSHTCGTYTTSSA